MCFKATSSNQKRGTVLYSPTFKTTRFPKKFVVFFHVTYLRQVTHFSPPAFFSGFSGLDGELHASLGHQADQGLQLDRGTWETGGVIQLTIEQSQGPLKSLKLLKCFFFFFFFFQFSMFG